MEVRREEKKSKWILTGENLFVNAVLMRPHKLVPENTQVEPKAPFKQMKSLDWIKQIHPVVAKVWLEISEIRFNFPQTSSTPETWMIQTTEWRP